MLWEVEREELGLRNKQSFVDLGCGNGLLVYLLSAEGVRPNVQTALIGINIAL